MIPCSNMPVKVAINGAGGRMGRRLLVLSARDPDVELVQAIEYSAHPMQGKVRAHSPLPPPSFHVFVGPAITRVVGFDEHERRDG